jgi:hypothetical protein
VTGKDKVAALARLREGDVTIPAGRIQRANALVLADESAAEELQGVNKFEWGSDS